MSANQIQVLCVAGRHTIAGTVDHGGRRLLEILNDGNTELLQISEADVFRQGVSKRVAQLKEVAIPKRTIDFLVLCENKHENPLRRQYAMVEKPHCGVFVALADHEIRGSLMVRSLTHPALVLNDDASSFFPITDPNLSGIGLADSPFSAQVALVNKDKVSLLQIERRGVDS